MFLSFLDSSFALLFPKTMCDEMEKDDESLGLEYLLYVKNISATTFSDINCDTFSFTNNMKIFH